MSSASPARFERSYPSKVMLESGTHERRARSFSRADLCPLCRRLGVSQGALPYTDLVGSTTYIRKTLLCWSETLCATLNFHRMHVLHLFVSILHGGVGVPIPLCAFLLPLLPLDIEKHFIIRPFSWQERSAISFCIQCCHLPPKTCEVFVGL